MRLFVTVGTDHHPFQRLLDWVGAWARNNPENRVVVQHGPAQAVTNARNHVMLTTSEMHQELTEADVVIVSGGPGAVMSARAAGKKPIAVARRSGEHVDEHQIAFIRLISERGVCFAAWSEMGLQDLLSLAESEPEAFRCDPPDSADPPAVTGIRMVIDQVIRPR